MVPSVKSVIPKDNYLLFITFSNDEVGVLDMKPYLDFGVFNRIRADSIFQKVRVVFDTVEWPSAGVDLDPEFVYEKCNKSPCELLSSNPLATKAVETV